MTDKFGRRQSVPCGRCYECRREKQQEWCFRLDQEMRFSLVSFFVTLTYEDSNLIFADDEPCLYKRHLQLHFKKLRKRLEPKSIKYYAVGEYGERSNPGRPHYHYLIFYRGRYDRFKLMQFIKECWDFGISQVLPINGAQGYVTKYILKFDKREHLVKPFSLVSHGLGIDYLSSSMVAYHRRNLIPYATKPGGYRVALPRYYKDKIFGMYQRLLIKKRADLYRRDLELVRLNRYDTMLDFGINPFQQKIVRYEQQLYQALKVFKEKKKI